MKTLPIIWNDVHDDTGYLFSFAKSLLCAVKNSPYAAAAVHIAASSGFAFRMWVSPDLCPSATSIWEFAGQKRWTENGGLQCTYTERLWGQDAIAEELRNIAVDQIRTSIDAGIPAISWDIGVCEWGLITGYDDAAQMFTTLPITGQAGTMPYTQLGQRELPLLSVLTLTGYHPKPADCLLRDTMALAVSHLRGNEWCENAQGLAAYPALYRHLDAEDGSIAASWNMEYFLGTYAPLKWYAWQFFAAYEQTVLADRYQRIYHCLKAAFDEKTTKDFSISANRQAASVLLKEAEQIECEAVCAMESFLSIKNP